MGICFAPFIAAMSNAARGRKKQQEILPSYPGLEKRAQDLARDTAAVWAAKVEETKAGFLLKCGAPARIPGHNLRIVCTITLEEDNENDYEV